MAEKGLPPRPNSNACSSSHRPKNVGFFITRLRQENKIDTLYFDTVLNP